MNRPRMADLEQRFRMSASESEIGRNLVGTPQTCREAADTLKRYREALVLGVAYDQLLREYSGPLVVLRAGDEVRLDAAYDAWRDATIAALTNEISEESI